MLRITKEIINELIEHAKQDAPVEACGYLAGKDGVIDKHYKLTNIDQSEEHFSFDPKEQFAVVKDARTNGLEVCATYHSHPETPARPSAEDIKLAYDPSISYIIVSLAGGTEDIKSFKITKGEVQPEPIEIIDTPAVLREATLNYCIPDKLENEINELESLIEKTKNGEMTPIELKVHRVPFGIYEQRALDTYMVRVRCAAGCITPEQLKKIAELSEQYGTDRIHLTTRQELQIHYVKLDEIITILRKLKKIGLASRGGGGNTVRNIIAQEDAGISKDEAFDITPYAIALTSRLVTEDDSWTLPRKFKVAFSGSAEDKGYATIADLGFIAKIKDGEKGFKVYIAGGLGARYQEGQLLFDFIPADEVSRVAKAAKTLFWKYGNRRNKHSARLRFLWQTLGEEEFKNKFTQEYELTKTENYLPLEIVKIENTSLNPHLPDAIIEDTKDYELWKNRFVVPQKQDTNYAVNIPVNLGFIENEKTIQLANFLKPFGNNVIRMTKDQNFLLRNISGNYLPHLYNFLKTNQPNFNRPLLIDKIIACAGASTCQMGIGLSRGAASAVMKILEESGINLDKLTDIKINISGCPNSCGQHQTADLGFFGKASRKTNHLYPAYKILAGAVIRDSETKFAENVGEISAKDLPKLTKDIVELYLSKASKFKNFAEYIKSEGKKDLKGLCEKYKNIPDFKEDKNYYYDWGSDKLFSLAERGKGECSAGLFDLIEMDLKNIRDTRKKLTELSGATETAEIAKKQEHLTKLVFFAARMLLITRAIEPKTEQEAFKKFTEHFIENGLIDSNFKELLTIAEEKNYKILLEKEADVYALADRVNFLYDNMDNAFNFAVPKEDQTSATSEEHIADEPSPRKLSRNEPKLVKDFRGVACPMNFVKTKIELAKLKPNEILEVWLDDGDPIQNVPGSVKEEGHTILEQKRIKNYWSVVIEKK